MNKLELELDEKKVLADGEYNLDELYGYIDYIAVTEKGLRKEGNFYIEDDPVDDGFGMIAAVELILLRNDWFRKYVKTLNCYWWDEETNSFDVEDGIEEAVRNWGSFHSGTYSSPTGIRKDAIPMHKLELILDEQRIIDDGLIRIDDVNNYLTREALENRGFEHRQGSGYLSKAPISKNKLIVLYDSLVEELPWLNTCSTAMHFADIGKTFNLKTLARNSSASISDVEFFRNQGTQKRTSRASAESKTQSARATGKDNIIQFAPRQNGKDIPSSKGTSLASKSQKYVAMANALNAASKSYVYRKRQANHPLRSIWQIACQPSRFLSLGLRQYDCLTNEKVLKPRNLWSKLFQMNDMDKPYHWFKSILTFSPTIKDRAFLFATPQVETWLFGKRYAIGDMLPSTLQLRC